MRLLFVVPHALVPPDRGNKHLTFGLLQWLCKEHSCDVVGMDSGRDGHSWEMLEAETGVSVLATFPHLTGLRALAARAACLFAGEPPSLGRYRNPGLARFLEGLDITRYDAVCIDMYMNAWLQPTVAARPVVLIASDAYSLAQTRGSRVLKSPLGRLRHRLNVILQRRFERRSYPSFDFVLCVSEVDAAWLEALSPAIHARTIGIPLPNEVVLRPPRTSPSGTPPVLLCWAPLDSEPAAEAVWDFVKEGWPIVRAAIPDVRLLVWGRCSSSSLLTSLASQQGVEHVPYVDDWVSFLELADVFVYPQRSGSGMQTKLQAAMALGIPVVTSPEMSGGLGAQDGRDVVLCEDAVSFGQRCAALLADQALRSSVGAAARMQVRNRFDSKHVGRQFLGIIEEAVAKRSGHPPPHADIHEPRWNTRPNDA